MMIKVGEKMSFSGHQSLTCKWVGWMRNKIWERKGKRERERDEDNVDREDRKREVDNDDGLGW